MFPWLFNDEISENGERKEASKILGGEKRMEISSPLVCR